MATLIRLSAEMTEQQAMALAQFLKRSSFSTYRDHAVNDDEAYQMIYAGDRIREDLAEKGFAPR